MYINIVVTEEEIDCAGLLSNGDKDQKSKCLVFTRNINNINTKHDKAEKFIDMTDSKVDDEKQGWLNYKLVHLRFIYLHQVFWHVLQ